MERKFATCNECTRNKTECKKGSMFHHTYQGYGIIASSPKVEPVDARFCAFMDFVDVDAVLITE